MTRNELSARAANLKRAISSPTTCTPAIVDSLRSFLIPPESKSEHHRAISTTKLPRVTQKPVQRLGRPPGPRSRKQPAINVVEIPNEEVPQSQPQERWTLATEIVNVTLQALTEAIKCPPSQRKRQPLGRSSSNVSFNGGLDCRSQGPLQPLCVNQVSNLPGKYDRLRRSSSTASMQETFTGLRAQAECARIAFASLRSLQARAEFSKAPHLQLESGMSALIARLITLKIDDLAVKELRILRRRLECSKKSANESAKEARSETSSEKLADMLKFSTPVTQGQCLILVVATQLQVLRILALRRDPNQIESALHYLRIDAPCSPANLIQRQINPDSPEPCTKAILQLESLAQTLTALCPNSSSREDHKGSKIAKTLNPHCALEYHLLALQVRSQEWELSGHLADIDEEIIEPFAKCMAAFRRRSTSDVNVRYDTATKALDLVISTFGRLKEFHDEKLCFVYQTLADMALEAGQHSEAIQWMKKSKEGAALSSVSQTQLCTLYCRLATVHIRISNLFPCDGLLDSLETASQCLEGNLQGQSTQLDDLLAAVASLRRSAFSVFQNLHRESDTARTSRKPDVENKCSNIVLLCVRFLLCYIGSGFSRDGSDRTTTRREQRLQLAGQTAYPIIESAATMARLSSKADLGCWTKLEGGLQDCVSIALSLEEANDSSKLPSPEKQQRVSPFVSLSNAYWFRYIYLRHNAGDIKASRRYLRTAIDLLTNRSSSEKVNGYLVTKLEKYGQLCETLRSYDEASQAYYNALRVEVESGRVSMAAKAADMKSIPGVLECDGELECLFRIVLAYPRVAMKANDQGGKMQVFFDTAELNAGERGMLLEYQLIAALSTLPAQGSSSTLSREFTSVGKTLLSLYAEDTFPVRRLRVVVRLLTILSANPGSLDCELRNLIMQEPHNVSVNSHLDTRLTQFLPHLIVSRNVLVSFIQKDPDLKVIEAALAFWLNLLQRCPDWESLQGDVHDVANWLLQLDSMAGYLEMQGLELTRASVLNVSVKILEIAKILQYTDLLSKLSALGLQYSRLGYSAAAGVILLKAQRYLDLPDVPLKAEWYLAFSEHSLCSGNLKTCKENLDKAQKIFYDSNANEQTHRIRSRDRSEHSQFVADVYYLHAALAAAEGRSSKALLNARISVKGYQRAWAITERNSMKATGNLSAGHNDSEHEGVIDSMSELSLSEHQTNESGKEPHRALGGAEFWRMVPRLLRGLTQLSRLYAFHGLLPEVQHYLGQAQKVANAVRAPCLVGRINALQGQFLTFGEDPSKGLETLRHAEILLSAVPQDNQYASLHISLAKYHNKHGQVQAARAASEIAERIIQKLTMRKFLDDITFKKPSSDDLVSQMDDLSIKDVKPVRQPHNKGRQTNTKKLVSKLAAPKEIVSISCQELPRLETVLLSRLKDEVQGARASTALRDEAFDVAAALMQESSSHPCSQEDVVLRALLLSRIRLHQKTQQLMADPVFCVMPESTISCPSVKACSNSQHKLDVPQASLTDTRAQPSKTQRTKAQAKKTKPRRSSVSKLDLDILQLAQTGLTDISRLSRKVSSTMVLHEVSEILGKVLLMSSAMPSSIATWPISSAFVVYTLEASRSLSMMRESEAVEIEKQLSLTKTAGEWPDHDASDESETSTNDSELMFANFQEEYIDLVPHSWTVVSMTLSESHDEIFICKIRAGQLPFVLRLPLNRHNALESDEESFGFDEAKDELKEIVHLANQSTHGAQDLSHKGAKTKWWEARATLDARLKDLLTNVESIWFGGFKGVFAQGREDPDLLARFQQSFENILDKYLPSRQRSGRGNQSGRVALDPCVVELFVGLGDLSETNEVDESLMDLLYFVVDILQCNGERNAYDEVDFDSVSIETIDALRHYHQAVKGSSEIKEQQHTILVLDKRLHCFPWESLPCMRGKAVTRLPSLGCLRDRILQLRQKMVIKETPLAGDGKFFVNRNSGTSILNPGGDLVATQSKFEEQLQRLSGWETTVKIEPRESEMKTALDNHEIFLYFGHGSGGQYIRSRTIKKLDKCAVALLMGCSSGALTEAGDFEPYGTPMNYMQAGCPAVVATLWDVTDKDIDRFSQTTLEKWGLFGEAQPPLCASPVKKSAKQKGKSRIRDVDNIERLEPKRMSLDEAVAQGRESCILGYLNGAAPVVHGIPIFLS